MESEFLNKTVAGIEKSIEDLNRLKYKIIDEIMQDPDYYFLKPEDKVQKGDQSGSYIAGCYWKEIRNEEMFGKSAYFVGGIIRRKKTPTNNYQGF